MSQADTDPASSRLEAQAAMFANRLRKNARHLARWARREGVHCYRLYDRDIPELPLAVDRYGDALVLAWFVHSPSPAGSTPEVWLDAMTRAAAEVLAMPREAIHARIRAPQKGTEQYSRLASDPVLHRVEEGGVLFEVDLAAHVDVGLFLDHRPLRLEVRDQSPGKDLLNLFCYTGAFSVHAAAAGARSTTSVDLNRTYLTMAERNLALNDLHDPRRHRLIRADVLAWLSAPDDALYDLAVVDPPTFSNSKKMQGVFDVQRDHLPLLEAVLARMRPGGVVYFSTNNRRFRPELDALSPPRGAPPIADLQEISHRTVPPHFRDRKIHRAWRIALG